MARGTYIIVIGPSGVGKSTVVEKLLERFPSSARLVTTTTRAKRQKADGQLERDGVDYHFLTREAFLEQVAQGGFLEYAEYSGNLYGSSRTELDKLAVRHPIVFGIVEVQGAESTKKVLPECVQLFIDAESMEQLRRRHAARKGATQEDIERRMARVPFERAYAAQCDRVIVNREGCLEETVDRCADHIRPYLIEFVTGSHRRR